jgi:hypothetical protein
MNYLKVIGKRLLALGLMLFFVWGCASNRGGANVEWGSPESVNRPEVSVAQKHGPPSHAPAHGNRAQYRYHYYPASEVYYSTWRRIYFYVEGNVWVSDALLPYRLRQSLGEYISVEIYSDTPYEYHRHAYKKHYRVPPGQANKKENWVKY